MSKDDLYLKLQKHYKKLVKLQSAFVIPQTGRNIGKSFMSIHDTAIKVFEESELRKSRILRMQKIADQVINSTTPSGILSTPGLDFKKTLPVYNKAFLENIEEIENSRRLKFNNSELDTSMKKNVFIIHGHDEANKLLLKEIIEKEFELEVIILNLKAGKGRTLIEKFEQEAEKVSYAFALFTPDDIKRVGKTNIFEARPNVIFELGWFYGRIKRKNVTILFKEGTNIPSDLDGISRIQFKDNVEDKFLEIQRELQAAGLIKSVKKEE